MRIGGVVKVRLKRHEAEGRKKKIANKEEKEEQEIEEQTVGNKEEEIRQEGKEKREKIEGGDEPGRQETQRSDRNPREGNKVVALRQQLIRDYTQNLNQQQGALTCPRASGSALVKSGTPKTKGRPKTVGRGVR